MTSYPPRRSIFPHRQRSFDTSESMGDRSVSASSVGTDRASNHGVAAPSLPSTVVAINSGDDEDEVGNMKEMKLTAEALAMANKQAEAQGNGIAYGMNEVPSSNLSRSSSESGLKTSSYGIPSQVKVIPSSIAEHGESIGGNETPAHFQPWEAGSVASSLGDPFHVPVATEMKKHDEEGKQLDHAVADLTSETPPKANLGSSKDITAETALPPLPANFNIAATPSSSPFKKPGNPAVSVDSTMASTLPPAAPQRSIPNSPMPASAMRSTITSASPSINKKATFQQPVSLTRTSSNASSNTTATNASTTKRIRLGICAMDKKARSKPMAEILSRLDPTTFEPVFFGDNVILKEPVESWPICDVLIAFYSNGYPLEKAEKYVNLRHPYLLNDLKMQRVLMDRRRVYDLLEEAGIDVPRHVFVSRDGYKSTRTGDNHKKAVEECQEENEFEEHDDYIVVNGVDIHKPFVEKPVDADDHNIAIYYPSSAGGGCKKLFRKVGDRSSDFYPDINEVRRDGSYIYEEFIETQGTDVKMYTVGPEYGHAEARKSPAVDGVVERNPDGKEVRFPVILTFREKEIARRIVMVFKQHVCGFDILRIQEGDSLVSYVCDVNGWSFVKKSRKYYDDCAQLLTEHMLAVMKPKSNISFSALAPLLATMEDDIPDSKNGNHRRNKSIVERVKDMLMRENVPSSLSKGINDDANNLPDLDSLNEEKSAKENGFSTQPVRELPDQLMTEAPSMTASGASSLADTDHPDVYRRRSSTTTHQEELRCVIAIVRHGDRTPKQKLKGDIKGKRFLKYFHDHSKNVKKDLKVKAKKEMSEFLETVKEVIKDLESEGSKKNRESLYRARHMRDILLRWKFSGLNRKLQMKPKKWVEEDGEDGSVEKCSEMQLIVKWGGDLTKLGEKQAINLGNRLRNELYPMSGGGGILRLHSTFRHDLKIKTSDEGRVMKTAASFAKGMLELEGDIPPILVSLVHKDKGSGHMLDPSGNKEVKGDLEECKKRINSNMQKDIDYKNMSKEERELLVGPESLTSLHRALKEVGNPRKALVAIHSTIGSLVEQLDEMLGELASGDEEVIEGGAGLKSKEETDDALSGIKLYKGETLLELTERWKLLQNKLYDEEKNLFDLSRVPDVHDNVRFDMLHNPHLGLASTLSKLYDLAKSMADCVVPQEYGTALVEKRDIGCKMCGSLLEKIYEDLYIARTDDQVDMRYLINMDYSSDLPINSMGRRVRSRLYFTSESHLHSLLNVLRISAFKDDCVPSPLSSTGLEIVSDASELCYLTQVVMRLFEDPAKSMDDPKRYRVEIWFSPGATATPMHMEMMYRENDASRFDTEKLRKIGLEGLTCSQVEDYFAEAINDGKPLDSATDSVEEDDKDKKKDTETKSTEPQSNERVQVAEVMNDHNAVNESATDKTQSIDKCSKPDEKMSCKNVEVDLHSVEATRRSVVLWGCALGAAAIALLLSRAVKGGKR